MPWLSRERAHARRRLRAALERELEQEMESWKAGQYAAALATYPEERRFFQRIWPNEQLPWRVRAVALDIVGHSLPRADALSLYRSFLLEPSAQLSPTAALLLLEQLRHEP
jgi:hypothetical protein